jgi:hypothetical protein
VNVREEKCRSMNVSEATSNLLKYPKLEMTLALILWHPAQALRASSSLSLQYFKSRCMLPEK